ncbi:MAG: translocation/assembly module TamB domain-containing protein [Alistipes sp.]|nr:translocation/assembly module TamB domain-containing protein [Alistipes sp.]
MTITLVLNIEAVQNVVADRASKFATDYLGVRVSIDHIDLDLFSRVRVEGFYVEDEEQDTLLYVERVRASISSLNIKRDGLCISKAEADGAKLFLKELANGEINIRPIVQKMQNPNSKGNFRLFIDDIDARDVEFRFERLIHRDPEYGIDYYDMQFTDVDARVEGLSVVKGVVAMHVAALSGRERSGFVIDNIKSDLYVNRGVIRFDEFSATTASSSIYAPNVTLNGADWSQYKQYIDKVWMTGNVTRSSISTYDLGYFAPGLREWNTTVRDIDATFDGVVRDFEGVLHSATIGNDSYALGTYHIIGLPDWRTSNYVIGIERVHATSEDIITLTDNILREPLPESVIGIIKRTEWVDARATFGGRLTSFRVVGNVSTGVGGLSGDVTMRKLRDGGFDTSGHLHTNELNVGRALNVSNLHALNSSVVLEGKIGGMESGGVAGAVDVKVESVGFGSYVYRDIEGVGHINGKSYYAEVNSLDPNLEFGLFANIDMESDVPQYALSLQLDRADLHAIGLNRRDSVSVLSANVGAELAGRTLDDIDGDISIADGEYHYPGGILDLDRMRVAIEANHRQKLVRAESEYFTLDYHSHSTYRDVYDYVYNSLKTYVPLLYDNGSSRNVGADVVNTPSDYTAITFEAGETINELLDAVAGGLVMAPDTEMGIMFNPKSNNLSLRGSSEALEYSGVILANAEWNINNNSVDSLSMRVKSSGVYIGARPFMPNFNLVGGARENRISITAGFKQEGGSVNNSAMLGLSAKFSRNAETNRRSVHIDISPSHFTNSTQQWKLFSRGIDIDSTRISVRDLHIARPDQQLVINGVASRERSDSIRLTLNNFDISPLSALINRWGYNVGGISNGYATVKSALNNPEIEASIDLDSIDVNGIKAPPQEITSNWDFEANRARVIIRDRESRDTVIRGYYQPQGNRYWAQARMRNIKLELISPFLKGIISDIEGDANILAEIRGAGRQATLSGAATVDSIGATVDYTKVRYTAPFARLSIDSNHITAERVPVYDPEGHMGHYSMDISLDHLSNITYDIDIDANEMLVLDTDTKDNDLFYGHVYASGTASFRGDKRGIKMDIEGTSVENSKFFMPLLGKEDVSYADFVKFKESDVESVDSTFLTRRMMAYERKTRAMNASGGMMDIDMTLNVLPNIEMQLVIDPTVGDVIKGKGSGQLNMHIVPKANIFEMRGDVQITEGTYLFTLQNIINKLFTVVPGSSIHWTGEPLGATLNIDAVYSTKASLRPLLGSSVQGIDTSRAVPVDCYIKLTDELMKPTVTFDVQVPNVAPEIQTVIQSTLNDQQAIATQMFWLLAANSFSAEDTGAMGASLSATTGFELLSNQLSNWLSGDNYNIVLRYRPRTELTGDEVDFGFSKSWLDDRLIVELEGGYLSDASLQATENASNFVGEAFITWLIDPEGTFRFRGFTQTIDRYGENQGMQESGVGLYYSESFNRFKDLWVSIREHFVRRDSLGREISRKEYRAIKSAEKSARGNKRDSENANKSKTKDKSNNNQ